MNNPQDDDRARRTAGHVHTVTVTTRLDDEGTPDERRRVDTVTFTCTAPPDADCRTYPDCDCERWYWDEGGTHDAAGHERTPGHQCWLQDWFDAGEGNAIYVGENPDDMRDDQIPPADRSGPISADFGDEWIEWDWGPGEAPSMLGWIDELHDVTLHEPSDSERQS